MALDSRENGKRKGLLSVTLEVKAAADITERRKTGIVNHRGRAEPDLFLHSLRYDDGPAKSGKGYLWDTQLKLAEETPPASSSCLINPGR